MEDSTVDSKPVIGSSTDEPKVAIDVSKSAEVTEESAEQSTEQKTAVDDTKGVDPSVEAVPEVAVRSSSEVSSINIVSLESAVRSLAETAIRQYLETTVTPLLKQALKSLISKILVREEPENPIEYLANFLNENEYNEYNDEAIEWPAVDDTKGVDPSVEAMPEVAVKSPSEVAPAVQSSTPLRSRNAKKPKLDLTKAAVQQYLETTVVPILKEALESLVIEDPENPIAYLANFLNEKASEYDE